MKVTPSNSVSSFICTLPIEADLRGLKILLRNTGYRIVRRGRGSRMGIDQCDVYKNPNLVKRYYQSFLPIKLAERQALYVRRGYSGPMECDSVTLQLLRNYVYANFPEAKMTVRKAYYNR